MAVEMEELNLREAVQNMHRGTATLAQSVPVRETFEGQTVSDGVAHVFNLAGVERETIKVTYAAAPMPE